MLIGAENMTLSGTVPDVGEAEKFTELLLVFGVTVIAALHVATALYVPKRPL